MAGLFQNLKADSSQDYRNAYQNTNQNLQNQAQLNKTYTGNAGFGNALQQGLSGAATTAGAAGSQSARAARNAGLSGAKAASMGAQQAADAYSNNFANQQAMAANMGNQAVGANQSLTSQMMGQAGMSQAEKQNIYNRASGNADRLSYIGENLANGAKSFFPAIPGIIEGAKSLFGLSDEKCKNITDEANHISEMVENIVPYLYEYKPEAQEKYGVDDDKHIGPMAQDMLKNPVTAKNVKETEDGTLMVDTKGQTLTNLALIADLAKRLSDIEERQ